MAKKKKKTDMGNRQSKEEPSSEIPTASPPSSLPSQFENQPQFSSTMPPRLGAPASPELLPAMPATQPEQVEKRKKKKKRQTEVQPEESTMEDQSIVEPILEDQTVVEPSLEPTKKKKKKKRQSEVQPEETVLEDQTIIETILEDQTIVEPALEPKTKKKKKKRQSEVQPLEETAIAEETLAESMQADEMVIDPAPERKKKKRKDVSEVPHVEEAPEPMQEEDAGIQAAPEKKRKKKKRQSEAPPIEESVIQELFPEPIQEDAMDVDPVPEPKRKKKKKRQSEVEPVDEPVLEVMQEDELVVDAAPERKHKKKKRHSQLPEADETTILEMPIVTEPIQEEDAVAEPSTEGKRKKKKKKRDSTVLDTHRSEEFAELEEPVAEVAEFIESMTEGLPEPKPKKKKKRQSTVDDTQLVDETTALEEPAHSLATHNEEAIREGLLDPDRKKKKKKKRQETLPEGDHAEEQMVIDGPIAELVQEEFIAEASAEKKRNKKRLSKAARFQLVEETAETEESSRQDVQDAAISSTQEDTVLEAPTEKRRKKKRHSRTAEVQESEETHDLEGLVSHVVQEGVLQTVQEEEAVVEGSPKLERKTKKKKKKKHLSTELELQEPPETSNLENIVSETFSHATQDEAGVAGESELQPVEESVAPEDDVASPSATNPHVKKRSRTEDNHQTPGTSSKKQRKHSVSFEVARHELEMQHEERPSLLATHLNGDTSAVVNLYQQRLKSLPREAHINGLSRWREESISTASGAEGHTTPISGEADGLDAHMDVEVASSIPPLATDDIESVASDEVGRPLGNSSPSIRSDSEAEPADGPDGAEDVDMYDAGLASHGEREVEEEEITATPYPESDRSSSAPPTHSHPTSQQDTEMPPSEPAVDGKAKSKRSRRKISEDKGHAAQEDEEMADADVSEDPPSKKTPKARMSTKRKPKVPFFAQEEGAEVENGAVVDTAQEDEEMADAIVSEDPPSEKTPKARMSTRRKPKAPFFSQEEGADGEVENGVVVDKVIEDEEMADAVASEDPPSQKTPTARMSRRRKPKAPPIAQEEGAAENGVVVDKVIEDEDAEAAAEPPASEHAGPSKSPHPQQDVKSQKVAAPKRTADGYYSGVYSPSEVSQVKTAVENFRLQENLTRDELVNLIHTTRAPGDKQKPDRTAQLWNQLWPSVMDACPTRKRESLIKWSRKQFHNYVARGAWTPEQDRELIELIKAHPYGQDSAQWAKIGSIINRHPEDCREHWRNKLIVESTRKLDYWTEQEEQQLYNAIQEAIAKIRAEGKKAVAEKSGEWIAKMLVNWQHISLVGMAGTRDNLQCRKKWNQLAKRNAIPEDIVNLAPPGEEWRIEAARKDLKRVTADDKVLLLRAIETPKVFMDHRINWKRILENVFGNRFERMALQWTWLLLKKSLSSPEKFTTSQCARRLLDMYEKEGNFDFVAESDEEDEQEDAAGPSSARDQSATPGVTPAKYVYREPRSNKEAGGSNDTASAGKSSAQDGTSTGVPSVRKTTARKITPGKTNHLSEEFVHDSDSDEVPESVQEEPDEEADEEADASLGEIPESVQENPDASPHESTQDPNESDVLPNSTRRRQQREPSIDLSFEASHTAALGSSRAQRTYGRQDRLASKLKAAMDLDEEQEAPHDGDAGEGEEPSPTKKKKRTKRKSKAIADSDAEQEAPPAETGDHEEPAASPAKRKMKRKSKAVADSDAEQDEEPVASPVKKKSRRKSKAVADSDAEEEAPPVAETSDHEEPAAKKRKKRKSKAVATVVEEEDAPRETESPPAERTKSKRKSKAIADSDIEQEAPLLAEASDNEEPAPSPAKRRRSKRKVMDVVHPAEEAAPLEIPPTPTPPNEEEEAPREAEPTPIDEEAPHEIEPTPMKKKSKRKSLTMVDDTEVAAEQEASPVVEAIPVVEASPGVESPVVEAAPVVETMVTATDLEEHEPAVTFDSDEEEESAIANDDDDQEEEEDGLSNEASDREEQEHTFTNDTNDSEEQEDAHANDASDREEPVSSEGPSERASTAATADSSDDDDDKGSLEIKREPSSPVEARTPLKRKRNPEQDADDEDEQKRPSPSLSIDGDAARENLLSRSSKKRRTRTTLSPSWEVPVDRPLTAMSAISSDTDMEDMEDIPATLGSQSQRWGWR